MEHTVLIREASLADLRAVAALYGELDTSHQLLDVELRRRSSRDRAAHLRAAQKDEHARLVVACGDRRVVGFVLAAFDRSRQDVVIEAIAVSKAFQRRGVGSELIANVERWAKQRKARYVKLDVYEFNPEARAFYERHGYLTTSRTMQKDPQLDVLAMVTSGRGRQSK